MRINPAVAALCILMLGCAGCRTPPGAAPDAESRPPLDMAEAFQILDAHNRRVALLQQLVSRGVIELRWIDDEGKEHAEPQIDARLWLDLPHRTALRGEKLEEELFWLGSDETRYWMFDLMNDSRTLYVGSNGDEVSPVASSSAAIPVHPRALLDLLALTTLSTDLSLNWVNDNSGRDLWMATRQQPTGGVKVIFDRSSRMVVRVEAMDRDGSVVMRSDLSRFVTVPVPGVSFAALPKFPTCIAIADADGRFQITLFLDEPSGDVSREPLDRVFDMERLRERFQPETVHEIGETAEGKPFGDKESQ